MFSTSHPNYECVKFNNPNIFVTWRLEEKTKLLTSQQPETINNKDNGLEMQQHEINTTFSKKKKEPKSYGRVIKVIMLMS